MARLTRGLVPGMAALALLLTACGEAADTDGSALETGDANSDAASEQEDEVETDEFVFGMLPSISPVFVGLEYGYFEEEGLDVRVEFLQSGSDLVPLLSSDELHAGTSSPAAGFFNALARDIPVRMVADAGRYDPGAAFGALVVRADLYESGEVTSVADLKGKTIGITAEGSAMHMLALLAVESGGLTADDVNLVTMGFPEMLASLRSGDVDAAMQTEPFLNEVLSSGDANLLMGADEIEPGGQQVVLMYSPGTLEDKDRAVRFMKGWLRSIRTYNDAFGPDKVDRERVVNAIAGRLDLDPAAVDQGQPQSLDPHGQLNIDSLRHRQQFWYDIGLVDELADVDDYVDDSYAKTAADKL